MSSGRPVTEQQIDVFLDGLRQCANVTASAEKAGMGRRTVYRHRSEDEAFREAWDAALELGLDALEDACMERAMQGITKFVVSQGRIVLGPNGEPLTEQVHSDGLAMFILKSRRPERYRDRATVDMNVQGDLAAAIEAGRRRVQESSGER